MENPYIEMLKGIQAQVRAGISTMPTSESLSDYDLGNVDCPKCHNMGVIVYTRDGIQYSRECECMAQRRSIRRIQKSGISDLLDRYTFDAYQAEDQSRKQIKKIATDFAETDYGWFMIAGQSGSGKTHICTAICKRLMERGNDVYYMSWRDESRRLKALINSDEIDEQLDRLKRVRVLYIDDFLKGGYSEADLRLAFEIINSRYNNRALRTIISSELGLKDLFDIDEAMAGRIYERARDYTLVAPSENWRLR